MYGKRQDLTSEPNHGIEQVYFSAIVARLDAIAIIDPIANAVREHGMKAKKTHDEVSPNDYFALHFSVLAILFRLKLILFVSFLAMACNLHG